MDRTFTDGRRHASSIALFASCVVARSDVASSAYDDDEGPHWNTSSSACAAGNATTSLRLVGLECLALLHARRFVDAGADGAPSFAGFVVVSSRRDGRVCHGRDVFRASIEARGPRPRVAATVEVGERAYLTRGLYWVDTSPLGAAPAAFGLNVSVALQFTQCMHAGLGYDRRLERYGCAPAAGNATATAATPAPPGALPRRPLPLCGVTALGLEGGVFVEAASCDVLVHGAPACDPSGAAPGPALHQRGGFRHVFAPPRCRYRLYNGSDARRCLTGRTLVMGDSIASGLYGDLRAIARGVAGADVDALCREMSGKIQHPFQDGATRIDWQPVHYPYRYGLEHLVPGLAGMTESVLRYDRIFFGSPVAHDISYPYHFKCQTDGLDDACLAEMEAWGPKESWRVRPLASYHRNLRLLARWFRDLRAAKPTLSVVFGLGSHPKPIPPGAPIYPNQRFNLLASANAVARAVMEDAGVAVLDVYGITAQAPAAWYVDAAHYHYCIQSDRNFSGGVSRVVANAYLGMVC